ncbi:uncharacterized protein LOC127880323 isoform X2 [Dreissena polymorpha]|uniref:uncharacterized protein LOC127880323 isoform X2 n=1 Tax=Dreissena polymorpha TaxID=45954 RepID=UPI002264AB5C|nr:uncharacterized protein LOC127880323 isoform X2 [Dreissena polymorpha]
MDHEQHIADAFANIHKHEWQVARAALSSSKHEEEIVYVLMRIVRFVYDMCTEDAWVHRHTHKHSPSQDDLEEFLEKRLPRTLHKDQVTKPVRSFIKACIKRVHEMTATKQPLTIYWLPKGDPIEHEKFELEGKATGHLCDWTVWPAVVKSDGTLLRKGVIIPI